MKYLRVQFGFIVFLAFLVGFATEPASAETLFTTQTPVVKNGTHNGSNYEKGLAFYSVSAGQITAVRFWKSSNESGTHIGRIWSNGGTLLASVTFAGETASGWQQQSLASPLTITANTTYVVSVNTTNGYFAYTDDGLDSQVSNGNLRSVVGNNGRYASVGQFPANSTDGTNFFRDVVFVGPSVSSVALSPSSLTGGSSSTGTVTLTTPAPSGGALVTLSSNNAAATVPASVTVSAGSTSRTFTVNTTAVGATTSASISATYNGAKSAALTIDAPTVSTISLNPTSVTGGSSSTGTVTLTSAAPSSGAVVTLSSSNAAATVPASVTVPAGSTSRTFTVNTTAVGATVSASISATYNGAKSAALTITAPTVSTISLNPTSVTGGSSSTGTVTLTSAAPSSGAVVTLSSSNAAATVPASVTVPAGSTSRTFTVNTTAVGATVSASISATYNGAKSAALTISPAALPTLSTLSLNPTSVTGGSSSTGTVTLSSAAPTGGSVVTLSSNNAAATVPASVTVLAGSTSRTFTVNTNAVGAIASASISATYNGTKSATLTINSPVLSTMSLNPMSVTGGNSTTGMAILNGPAPTGGAVVALSSVNPIVAGIQGVHSPADLPHDGSIDWMNVGPLFGLLPSSPVLIAGMPGSMATVATANSRPPQILDNCSSGGNCGWYGNFASGMSILWIGGVYNDTSGTWAGNGPLTITFNSPKRGIGFSMMADELGPFTATLCAYDSTNAPLGCILFTGNSTGTADGSAVYVGLYDDVADISKVTVDAGGALYPHDFAIGQVHVASTRRQMVPASVTVPAGATGATFPVSTSAVPTNTVVTVSGTYVMTQSASLTIDPPVLSALSLNPASVTGGNSSTGTVTLTGPAPAGGVAVTLLGANPTFSGIQAVHAEADLPYYNSADWNSLGPLYGLVASGVTTPIPGTAGSTMAIWTATGLPAQLVANCSGNCGWYGNFKPGEKVLWMSGTYNGLTGGWAPNGPLTISFNNPQRGVGFHIMADELGPFTATLCAYNSTNAPLGCKSFTGNSTGTADGSAVYVGLYDDVADISKVTVDAGGALYPHDFAIGQVYVTSTQRQLLPASVTVAAGNTSATFAVAANSVNTPTSVTITGSYSGSRTATLQILP